MAICIFSSAFVNQDQHLYKAFDDVGGSGLDETVMSANFVVRYCMITQFS